MRGLWIVPLALGLGCSQSDFGGFPTPDELPAAPDGPGHPAWGSEDISCETADDCAPNETCENQVCMPVRCSDGPYDSKSPIGRMFVLYGDKEVVVADAQSSGGHWVDGYSPNGSSLDYRSGGSFNLGAPTILDVAGGNMLGSRPDGVVAAVQSSSWVRVRYDSSSFELDVGFQPIAVATGDVDQDGMDEVLAVGSRGQYAVCDADTAECTSGTVDGANVGIDVTAGDVDGDGFAEGIFLVERGGDAAILGLNVDHEATGEPKWIGGPSNDYMALAAGVIDDTGTAKVVALRDGGYVGFGSDKLETLELAESGLVSRGSVDVDSDSKDVGMSDVDMDGRAEIGLLYDENILELRRPLTGSNHQIVSTKTLTDTGAPSRVAFADLDGDSAIARQVSGPELVPGGLTPIMALQFPPYSRTYSDSPGYLFIGRTENISEDFSDSMSVRYGIGVGLEAKIQGVVRLGFMARFGQEWSRRQTNGQRQTIGGRFSIDPNIEMHGNDYSVVMLTTGCFHAYGYEIDDPRGRMEPEFDGSAMGLMVPVGGQMTVWSSKRYNALARHVGGLPIINTPVRIGDPSSYPTTPQTTAGLPVDPANMVFQSTPTLNVSDVSVAGYWLAVSDYQINETSQSIDISGYGNFGVGPATVNVDTGLNNSRSHSINVGQEAIFGGGVPPIPDDPNTPEDELASMGFSYSPKVHVERYVDANGNDAGYYALTFTVGN